MCHQADFDWVPPPPILLVAKPVYRLGVVTGPGPRRSLVQGIGPSSRGSLGNQQEINIT